MSSKTVFLLSAVVSGIFALVALIAPNFLVTQYGVEFTDELGMMARFFGTAMLVISLVSFYLKDASMSKEVKSVVMALIISDIVGFVVSLLYTLNNVMNGLGWLNVIIYGFFTIAFYTVYNKK